MTFIAACLVSSCLVGILQPGIRAVGISGGLYALVGYSSESSNSQFKFIFDQRDDPWVFDSSMIKKIIFVEASGLDKTFFRIGISIIPIMHAHFPI